MVQVYLPKKPGLIRELDNLSPGPRAGQISIDDVKNLLVGVHLAVASEAMSFSKHLGIDPELMLDIVSNAAGASNIFIETFAELRRAAWSLKAMTKAEQIRLSLVS